VCEKYFRPQNILRTKLLVNDAIPLAKSLLPHYLPVPINSVKPESDPVLRTYKVRFKTTKNSKADDQLPTKKLMYALGM